MNNLNQTISVKGAAAYWVWSACVYEKMVMNQQIKQLSWWNTTLSTKTFPTSPSHTWLQYNVHDGKHRNIGVWCLWSIFTIASYYRLRFYRHRHWMRLYIYIYLSYLTKCIHGFALHTFVMKLYYLTNSYKSFALIFWRCFTSILT